MSMLGNTNIPTIN